ncbi:MAG: hypothetical protein AB1508_12435 [Pseudomonadota bacterium]
MKPHIEVLFIAIEAQFRATFVGLRRSQSMQQNRPQKFFCGTRKKLRKKGSRAALQSLETRFPRFAD